ncbi:hypothetical protein U14_04509 [Candidatus Moduliflexus flocculans]|uniref:Uncharacterized protein n=1 Tax=Candidatus Moduliflexus flocculans TaxID=1499966 RepID=A0A0S6W4F3_9BACT|nr:hypothetical protein U14_04509 [Candidatus Moduliflexus flocculans]
MNLLFDKTLLIVLGIVALSLFSLRPSLAFAAKTDAPPIELVMIDARQPAYTVLIGIPRENVEQVEKQAKEDGVTLLSWKAFETDAETLIGKGISKNEYPEIALAKGIIVLLKLYPAMPFGVTWNGGVAVTYSDYKHAEKLYDVHHKSADEYEQKKPKDRASDPIHPENQFGALLGDEWRK